MVSDTGAEEHVIAGCDYHRLFNIRPVDTLMSLETANGSTRVEHQGDCICGGVLIEGAIYWPTATSSLLGSDKYNRQTGSGLEQDEDAAWNYVLAEVRRQ